MSSSSPSLPENFWGKMARTTVMCFALALVPALLAMLVLHKTVGEMVGPYLACAVLVPIFVLASMGLRVWEDHGASPRRLALAWTLMMTVFVSVIDGATVYSVMELHLVAPDDLVSFVISGVIVALIPPFIVYRRVLTVTTARAAKRPDGAICSSARSGQSSESDGRMRDEAKANTKRMFWRMIVGSLMIGGASIGEIKAIDTGDYAVQSGWTLLALLGGLVVISGLRRYPK